MPPKETILLIISGLVLMAVAYVFIYEWLRSDGRKITFPSKTSQIQLTICQNSFGSYNDCLNITKIYSPEECLNFCNKIRFTNQEIDMIENQSEDFLITYENLPKQRQDQYILTSIQQRYKEFQECNEEFEKQRNDYFQMEKSSLSPEDRDRGNRLELLIQEKKELFHRQNQYDEEFRQKKQQLQDQIARLPSQDNIKQIRIEREKKIENYQQQIQTLEFQIANYQIELQTVQQNFDRTRDSLENLARELDPLTKDYNEISPFLMIQEIISRTNLAVSVQRKDNIFDLMSRLEQGINERIQNLKGIEQKDPDSHRKDNVQQLQIDCNYYKNLVQDLENQYQVLVDKYGQMTIEEWEIQLKKLELTIKEKEAERQKIMSQLNTSKEQIENLNNLIKQNKQTLESNQSSMMFFQEQQKEFEENLDDQLQNRNYKERELEELMRENTIKKHNFDTHSQRINLQIQQLQQEINQMNQNYEKNILSLKHSLQNLENKLKSCFNVKQYLQFLVKEYQNREKHSQMIEDLKLKKKNLINLIQNTYPDNLFSDLMTLKIIEKNQLKVDL